jgi:hypothetical protein
MQTDDRRIREACVIPWTGDLYGIALTFDCGRRSALVIGSKAEAEKIAAAAIGQGQELLQDLEAKAQLEENRRFRIVDFAPHASRR